MKKIHINMKSILIFSLLLIHSTFVWSQAPKRILLLDAFLHVGNGEVLERSAILIVDGKISDVRNSLTYSYQESDWDTIIHLEGKHIYPGFVAPNTTLGLTEIDAVRATRDFDEVGYYNPHVRSQIAFNVESKVLSTVRTNGVLLGQPTPRGGRISGSSSVMRFDGWNWEDATISAEDGIHVNWPSSLQGGGWWAEPAPKERNKNYSTQLDELYAFFEMSKAYEEGETVETDTRLESMKTVFQGQKRVYFHAEELQQLLDVLDFCKHFKLKFPVIVGGYDSYLITEQLRDQKIAVMLPRVHSLPENEGDPVDLPYRLPALLQAGEVKFCLQNSGDMEAMNARNIPFLAGTARAYGLSTEEAVRSISLSACEILGIDKMYGSIEKGKSATLFVSEGDALDMRGNKLQLALIDGQFMSLDNVQTDLYYKYTEKYQKQK
jgi:hypothetical protein